ncbi:MAG TPA: UbiA family prenyltransferase [Oligoflexia bacterium]|nr:UbiA family prenyltransferase [Oligoflexia bacterium]
MPHFHFSGLILEKMQRLVSALEDPRTPLTMVFTTFLAVVIIRNIFEGYATGLGVDPYPYVHYTLFYLTVALSIVALFHFLIKEQVVKLIRVVFSSFIFLIIAPLADLIILRGKRYSMSYLLPGVHEDILLRYFTFFGDFRPVGTPMNGGGLIGITPGIRIEIAIVLVFSAFFIFLKTKSHIRTLVGVIALYTVIFTYLAFPYVTGAIGSLIPYFAKYTQPLFIHIYTLLSLLLGVFLSYRASPYIFLILIGDIRLFRLLHYLGFFVLGVMLGMPNMNNTVPVVGFILLPLSVAFAWVFSVMTNNIADIEIDRISNTDRPLVAGTIDPALYQRISWFFLVLAFFTSLVVDKRASYLILVFISVYFVYSMPPLRLKRVPILSKMAIGINTFIMTVLGLTFVTNSSMLTFPGRIGWFIVVSFTLAANLIDIKDYAGDKAAGIMTLPSVLGLRRAKHVISLFIVGTYVWGYLLIKKPLFIPVVATFSVLELYLINRKDYSDRQAIGVYLLSIIVIGLLLIFR